MVGRLHRTIPFRSYTSSLSVSSIFCLQNLLFHVIAIYCFLSLKFFLPGPPLPSSLLLRVHCFSYVRRGILCVTLWVKQEHVSTHIYENVRHRFIFNSLLLIHCFFANFYWFHSIFVLLLPILISVLRILRYLTRYFVDTSTQSSNFSFLLLSSTLFSSLITLHHSIFILAVVAVFWINDYAKQDGKHFYGSLFYFAAALTTAILCGSLRVNYSITINACYAFRIKYLILTDTVTYITEYFLF